LRPGYGIGFTEQRYKRYQASGHWSLAAGDDHSNKTCFNEPIMIDMRATGLSRKLNRIENKSNRIRSKGIGLPESGFTKPAARCEKPVAKTLALNTSVK
jgi:hypothetical protein